MQNDQLTIVAKIWAKEGKRDFIKSELIKLIAITKAEEGCINYDLHEDNEDPNVFLFYENWTSRELWQQHMKAKHLEEYMEATEGAVEKFTLNEMTIVDNV
ncbi:putative quinol monooxygenase [Flagellimonas pacifica]|uniref:Quinol monooxygenase YgiN n=1 Tax=Flagellimonas pacifica TaxID=1247520 RepID=A0A285MTU0_9FLAO|nr:putative quinol monooxygenase [Allomuricauda parva]SNY99957.1 Quinol monooxygenase YgiN [Allomuricauda parva]